LESTLSTINRQHQPYLFIHTHSLKFTRAGMSLAGCWMELCAVRVKAVCCVVCRSESCESRNDSDSVTVRLTVSVQCGELG